MIEDFGLAAGAFTVWALAVLEEDELLVEAGLLSACVLPGTASAEIGANAIATLSALANQRVAGNAGLGPGLGPGMGKNATFILPLYDDLVSRRHARTTRVNFKYPVRGTHSLVPCPLVR